MNQQYTSPQLSRTQIRKDFWSKETEFIYHNRTFCQLFQHKGMQPLLHQLTQDSPIPLNLSPNLLLIPALFAFQGTLGLANSEHFFTLFRLTQAAINIPNIHQLLVLTFNYEWELFLLMNTLD